ncbi:EamA family transporter [Actimicrobium sp. CCC2.4]|uniref:DMT family transporter n=1 Tax=Actimicrobium sp. CCC2.4 TaxID=3048606 RepID=UPI002AC94778|nr:EamA family transporter [Actimicrobium sp. CCC2.4]MEB0135273.1 EamA family transporter [Actimicrobium sp. CCC2.4]WPX31065.1 EamA family transporter [Actimicrobium sp. CCC2.4]
MDLSHPVPRNGIAAALGAALLFGAATPLAKWLLGSVGPWMLAGLLYLGSGLGLMLWRRLVRAPRVQLPAAERRWFAGAILAGGVIGPALLMLGLTRLPGATVSLMLNAETVFTALLAWCVFRENVDRRIAFGMAVILAGALLLSWSGTGGLPDLWPALAVLGACLAWGIDNNLTRKVSLTDATWIAGVKGLVAGPVNLGIAFGLGAPLPSVTVTAAAMLLGLLAYGVSLSWFVVALRHLGSARTGAYFSVAPFFGALLAVLGGETVTPTLLAAGALMAIGVVLHLTERHAHVHHHEVMAHAHRHTHDLHHQHEHEGDEDVYADGSHSHPHRHDELLHAHAHFPDVHHRHGHG